MAEDAVTTDRGTSCDDFKTVLTMCPKCRGKGFITDVVVRENGLKSSSEPRMPIGLPKIRSPTQNRYGRPQKSAEPALPLLPSRSLGSTNQNLPRTPRGVKRLPPIKRERSVASSEGSFNGEIIPQVEIVSMPEFLRRAKNRMKSGDLEEVSLGVVDVIHISRTDENLAYALMPVVNRHLVEMLRSLRVMILRRACQAISHLFRKMSYITRPEFDEMLVLLLKRTADTKKKVREDAADALDVVVSTSPPVFVIRALCMKGPDSKNPSLRATTARILARCVDEVGRDQLLTNPALREMRKRVLESGCSLLLDPHSEVRAIAKSFMSSLKEGEGFDDALESDAPRSLLKEVERNLIWLRHVDEPSIPHLIAHK